MAFCSIPWPSTCVFNDPYTKTQLKKWDLEKASRFHMFRYTKYYHKLAGTELVLDLLNDPAVQDVLQVMVKGGGWQGLAGSKVASVSVEAVPCTLTRTDIFDKLTSSDAQPPIVRPATGDLVRCMDDTREGFQIGDNLREMLLCEESENACLYSDEEKSQLLWRIFEHLCLGGPCCQFEDKLDLYTDAAKRIYKELVTVQKNASTGAIEVASTAYKVTGVTLESGESFPLFPTHSRNGFLYVTVDPLRRIVRLWYHAFVPFW